MARESIPPERFVFLIAKEEILLVMGQSRIAGSGVEILKQCISEDILIIKIGITVFRKNYPFVHVALIE